MNFNYIFSVFLACLNVTFLTAGQSNIGNYLCEFGSYSNEPSSSVGNLHLDFSKWIHFESKEAQIKIMFPAAPVIVETAKGCYLRAVDDEGMTFTVEKIRKIDFKEAVCFFDQTIHHLDHLRFFSLNYQKIEDSIYSFAWSQNFGDATCLTFIEGGDCIYVLKTAVNHSAYINYFDKGFVSQDDFDIVKRDFMKIQMFINSLSP